MAAVSAPRPLPALLPHPTYTQPMDDLAATAGQFINSHLSEDVFERVVPPPAAPAGRLAADAHDVQVGVVHSWGASFVRRARTSQPTGVVLVLHGFTSAPWQFYNLSDHLTHAGLDVYAPRAPGHGRVRDALADSTRMPGSAHAPTYAAFAEAAFREAQALALQRGVPLHVLGYSLGGAMALDIASHHPADIGRVMLVAPLLRPRGRATRLLYSTLRGLKALQVGKVLMHAKHYTWGPTPPPIPQPWPGYWRFRVSQLYASINYAQRVARQCPALKMPVQLLLSAEDEACDPDAPIQLVRQNAPQGSVCVVSEKHHVTHSGLAEAVPSPSEIMIPLATGFLAHGNGFDATL